MCTTIERPPLLIVDSWPVVAEGVATLLGSDFEVVGIATDTNAALAVAADRKPAIALVDTRSPGREVYASMRAMRDGGCRPIAWSYDHHEHCLDLALRSEAAGLVSKRSESVDELRSILRRVADGEWYVSAPWQQRYEAVEAGAPLFPIADLTEQHVELLRMTARGAVQREIASVMGLNERKVRRLAKQCGKALGASGKLQLVRNALAAGVIFPEDMRG